MSSSDWVESSTDFQTVGFDDAKSPKLLSAETNTGINLDEEQPSPATEVEPLTEQTVLKIRIYRLKK